MSGNETWLKVRPREPLILGGVRAGSNFLNTVPCLPSRVLRGAWADWLVLHDRADEIAARLAEARIGNFFPAPEWRPVHRPGPLPLSALTCKRVPGFRSAPHRDLRGHGVVDTLIPQLAYALLRAAGAEFAAPFLLDCATCQGRMEPASGLYAEYEGHAGRAFVDVRMRYYAQTKVALDRRRRAAAEAMLYTVTALSPRLAAPEDPRQTVDLAFLGRVQAPPDALAELLDALNAVPLGALRGRGFGRVVAEVVPPPAEAPLAERLERFNAALAAAWADLRRLAVNGARLPAAPAATYFTVDLLAPAVFRDRGLPALVPPLALAGARAGPAFWLTRPDYAAGWSTAWGLPKPTDLAARAGSVYVFAWDGPREALLPTLERLETLGVGERSEEGFGECRVCHPFHEEMTER